MPAGLSFSGGGVGGNTLRLLGGSDCCRLLCSPGLTRLLAANESASVGRSSFASMVTFSKVSRCHKVFNFPIYSTYPLVELGSRKARECVASVGCGHEPCLPEVIFLLKVPNFGFVRSVDNADGDREDGVPLSRNVSWLFGQLHGSAHKPWPRPGSRHRSHCDLRQLSP